MFQYVDIPPNVLPVDGHLSYLQFLAMTSKLLSPPEYEFLCRHTCLFLLDKYSGIGWLFCLVGV